jgi:hypothetical protein
VEHGDPSNWKFKNIAIILHRNGLMSITESREKKMDVEAIENLIIEFCDKHNIDLEDEGIGETIYQNDEAQIDALEYFIKILEVCQP